MSLYVVISDACQNDARRHGQEEQLSNLKTRIEKAQNLTGFDFFPPQFVKRALGRSYRLIGYRVPFGSDELLLFLRILSRSDSDYDYFLKNWEQNKDAVIRRFQPYNDEELRQMYDQVTSVASPSPFPEPNAEEREWLYDVFPHERQIDDPIVLESETWVKKMRENRESLELYHRMLYELNLSQLHAATDNSECRIYWESDRGQSPGIAYLYRQDINRLLLLVPLRRTDSDAALLEKHKEKLSRLESAPEELLRVAARSYPFYMVLDWNAWLAIQKNDEANLAFSPEEAELLDSIRRMGAEGQLSYPLFINGRAGSGKSTMLQHLAADYIDFALRRGAGQRLLYTTCSSDLLERAREVVRQLLTIHHKRLLEGTHESDKIDTFIERSFVVFHDFLYSLLPVEIQKQLPRDRYVDYSRFRRLWDKEFARRQEARRMSPDVAWHTIRSYIKGIRSSRDDELSPEEFRTLPRRRRSVSEETYQQVYERVWQSWYKRLCDKEEEGYWDDQDLAACVLEKGLAQTVDCAALFCDEAQDFTPLELDIIYQLSLFGRRSLQPEELKRVPIVFAGDPLQTINPTGFRWDAVQADFHERFCAVLDPRRKARVDISHRELNFNYRSNPGVVHFCNLIQLARAALLGPSDITPQESWWVDTPKIIHLAEDTEATKGGIRQRPDFVKLVNCEEGEESDYVGKDPILSTLQENVEGVYRNVFSPMRAKGLEFPAVVLYRFGDTAPPDFERLLRGEIDIDAPEARLPYEYFFNRLYVAASRAKEDLVIVDSRDAIQRFWRFATEPEWAYRLMQRVRNPEQWKGRIAHPVCGVEKWWEGERVDPLQQAQDYEREGRTKRDPYLLRQAALSYRSAGDESSAGTCLAFAAELESRYRDAGDMYRDLGLREDAFRCYWEGREWARLCDLAAPPSAFTNRLESRAADFMNRTAVPDSNFLNELVRAARDNDWFQRVLRDSVWYDVLVTLAQRLTTIKADETLPWRDIFEILQRFRTAGAHINNATLAKIAYRAHKLEEAVELWEDARETNHEEYYRAKARVTDFPENINWFNKLGEHSEVLRQWNRHPSVEFDKLEKSTILAVADSALEECKITLAIRMLQLVKMLQSADREIIKKLLVKTMEKGDSNDKKLAAVIAARLFVHTRDWDAAIRAAEHGDFSSLLGKGQAKNLQSMLRDTAGAANVFRTVVEELAGSERLGSETDLNKKPVAEFLYRNFVKEEGVSSERLYGLSSQVVGAALRRVDEALQKKAKDDLVDAIKRSDVESAQAAAVSTARLFVRTGDWNAAIRAAEHADFSSLLGEQAKNLQSMLGDTAGAANVFCTIVEELAESENLAAETARSKDLADFLYRNFVKEEGVSSKKLHGLSSQVVGAVLERVSRTLREKAKDDLVDAIKRSDVESAQAAAVSTARLFVRTGDWNAAIRAAEHADFSSLLGEQAKNLQSMLRDAAGATNVFRTVVEELAGSEKLVSETAYNKELVANFLYRNFIQEKEASSEKPGDLSLRIVGAAIERAGKIINALKFYEDLQRSESEELKRFATERLVRNLERYADYFRSRGEEEQSRRRQLRAQEIRKQSYLRDRPIPDYPVLATGIAAAESREQSHPDDRSVPDEPVLDTGVAAAESREQSHPDDRSVPDEPVLDTGVAAAESREPPYPDDRSVPDDHLAYVSVEPAEPSEWSCGPLKIVLSRVHRRLRIEYKERFETVTVDGEGNLRGDADFSRVNAEGEELAAWKIPDWNTRVSVVARASGRIVVVETGGDQYEFPLSMSS